MKKYISLCLVLVLLLSLCACGGEPASTAAPTTTAPAATKPAPTVQVVEGEPIGQLDDVSVYIGVTGKSRALDGLPDYTYSEGGTVSYKGAKKGRYDQTTHIFNNTDAAAFIAYLNALESDGWEQYSNNIIEGVNLFATYTKGGQSLYCYYIPVKNRTLLIHSPYQNLEARQQDNQYETVCDPQLTQIKLLCKQWPGGMSYLIRLSDGRFVMIDGGYTENDYYEARHIYELMEQQNVLDKITIAAWIVTHPHKDHLGATSDFLRYYTPADVEIQQFIYNFPSDEVLMTVEAETATDTSDPSKMPTFLMALESLWPDTPVTVCHTGQEYYFADAKIEILHTLEDFYPQDLLMQSQDPVNGASVVFSLEIAGQKTMFLADSAVDCSKDLVKMWGSYLKSDIMQASHHGLNGGSVPLYEAIDPAVVMVPMCTSFIPKILSFTHSQWIWNNVSGNIKEVILSGWEQRTLQLPYTSAPDASYFSIKTDDPWAGTANEYKK